MKERIEEKRQSVRIRTRGIKKTMEETNDE